MGGVAVVLHGHPRFTADLDLVLSLDADNLARALPVLEDFRYRPRGRARDLEDVAALEAIERELEDGDGD